MINNIFSVDVEDWFHILDTDNAPDRDSWRSMESRVEANTNSLLDLLDRYDTKVTFFVLGWIAEHHPELVKSIAGRGHEIASHGYSHDLVYQQSQQAFRADIRKAADAIEKVSGQRPQGYRAPGFSITKDVLWAFDILVEEGYRYDSSVFPASRGHGGIPGANPYPWIMSNGLKEFPISTVALGGRRLSYIGGGYLRVMPFWLIKKLAERQLQNNQGLILYVHPRDVDPGQPRLDLGTLRNFKSYVGLGQCADKLEKLLQMFRWTAFRENLDAIPIGK